MTFRRFGKKGRGVICDVATHDRTAEHPLVAYRDRRRLSRLLFGPFRGGRSRFSRASGLQLLYLKE